MYLKSYTYKDEEKCEKWVVLLPTSMKSATRKSPLSSREGTVLSVLTPKLHREG